MMAIKTTAQLRQIISWVEDGQMPIAQFAFIVGLDLGLFSDRDQEYLKSNGGIPTEEMILAVVQKVADRGDVDCSSLHDVYNSDRSAESNIYE